MIHNILSYTGKYVDINKCLDTIQRGFHQEIGFETYVTLSNLIGKS